MKFELYPLLQSVHHAGHSTETALLKVQNDILLNMDQTRVTLLVLLDLSLTQSIIKCYSGNWSLALEFLDVRYVHGFYLICHRDLSASATRAVTPRGST